MASVPAQSRKHPACRSRFTFSERDSRGHGNGRAHCRSLGPCRAWSLLGALYWEAPWGGCCHVWPWRGPREGEHRQDPARKVPGSQAVPVTLQGKSRAAVTERKRQNEKVPWCPRGGAGGLRGLCRGLCRGQSWETSWHPASDKDAALPAPGAEVNSRLFVLSFLRQSQNAHHKALSPLPPNLGISHFRVRHFLFGVVLQDEPIGRPGCWVAWSYITHLSGQGRSRS